MSTVTISFSPNKTTDLILEIDYDWQEGEKQTWESPGYPDHIVVNSATCIDIDEEDQWIDPKSRAAAIIGELCLQLDRKTIERRTYEQHCEQTDFGPDPDDARDAYLERQRLRRERGDD